MHGFMRKNAQETLERIYGFLRVIYPVPKLMLENIIGKGRLTYISFPFFPLKKLCRGQCNAWNGIRAEGGIQCAALSFPSVSDP